MKRLSVELGERSYPLFIGTGLLREPELLTPYIGGQQVLVVTNDTVAPLYGQALRAGLADYEHAQLVLPDGEQYKTLEVVSRIFDELLARRFDRQATVIALGGGVIGDMAGFGAAVYQRGIPFIQVPTTLLAQVDSSVGGKTAVNHPLGKNMIGAFHQPQAVLIDTDTLNSLDDRQLRAGLAEVIKYGLIRDQTFFCWLEGAMLELLARDPQALAEAIERSCGNKAAVVAADEREADVRAILNLGHTFGHAIEAGLGYGVWFHGEAVAAGMCMAAALSERQGWLTTGDRQRIEALVAQAGLPTRAPASLSPARMLELMSVDKKAQQGRMRLVLLTAIGAATTTPDYDPAALQQVLAECRANNGS